MSITITTDHKWKPFVYGSDVPTKILASDFDYMNADDQHDGFFKYRNSWYHLNEFLGVSEIGELKEWHGYMSDSFYSGVVIKISKDGESYQIGTYVA